MFGLLIVGPKLNRGQLPAIDWLKIHSAVGERMTRCLNNTERTLTGPKEYHAILERSK